jgi:hypothetical protein
MSAVTSYTLILNFWAWVKGACLVFWFYDIVLMKHGTVQLQPSYKTRINKCEVPSRTQHKESSIYRSSIVTLSYMLADMLPMLQGVSYRKHIMQTNRQTGRRDRARSENGRSSAYTHERTTMFCNWLFDRWRCKTGNKENQQGMAPFLMTKTPRSSGCSHLQGNYVRFQVSTAVTMKNAVFWDIKTQFILHRRHITSLLQSAAG